VLAEKRLPSQRRDRPGIAPEFPHCSPVSIDGASLASRFVRSIALDLDAVLVDTRTLWRDWVEDAARRARVPLDDLPEDRAAAATLLDERLGDWRPLLERFAADRAPLHFRPRPDVGAAIRRLHAAGAHVTVYSDAPRELAELAVQHLGIAGRVELVAQPAAGDEIVESRAQLLGLK
jgi:phosphoglycolate phosphatase-like HAD superfamily hydrolase